MSTRDNFSKAAQEMFGLGNPAKNEAKATPAPEVKKPPEEDFSVSVPSPSPAPAPAAPAAQTTILAEGSVFEGTLRAKGNVELCGRFKGDVFSEGSVIIRTGIEGNVQANSIELASSSVKGDLTAAGQLKISERSAVAGNLTAQSIVCAGSVTGNMQAGGSVSLLHTAQLTGDLTAASVSIEEGALLDGRVSVGKK